VTRVVPRLPRTAQELLVSVAGAGIDGVPATLAVHTPTRGNGGLGAVVGLAICVVDAAVAAAPLSGPGPGVVEHGEDGTWALRPLSAAS
jgi:hypothetical protein